MGPPQARPSTFGILPSRPPGTPGVCFHCRQSGHLRNVCPWRNVEQPSRMVQNVGVGRGKEPVTCFRCGQQGHIQRNCPQGGCTLGAVGDFQQKPRQATIRPSYPTQSVAYAQRSRATRGGTTGSSSQHSSAPGRGQQNQLRHDPVLATLPEEETSPELAVIRDWAKTHESASRTSLVVSSLIEGGATCIGKTVVDEMASSISGENKHYGTPTNPAAPARVPGGSSCGSAVAVAANLVDFSLEESPMQEKAIREGSSMEGGGEKKEESPMPIFRDIRRYNCDYCGISRSKKSLLISHIFSVHQDEMRSRVADEEGEREGEKSNTCGECGASFRKPAYLKQHMQSHSLERPFSCPVEDCHSSYRRKDHLTRHLLQHQGKLFQCPAKSCNRKFAFQGNMNRHVKKFHDEESPSINVEGQKEYICQEIGCGKVFKYASKLRKHENSHVRLEAVEVFCLEPGCMKHFSNEKCLMAHLQSCHSHITCEVCGTKQLKKNIKRHLRMHESGGSSERIKCNFKGCLHTFSTKSNLRQHIKAVHFELKPFACSISGCGMRFPFKHVKDNHEKSGLHVYTHGDFEESDEQFRRRPRGGHKRKCPMIETLTRKRVIPPSNSDSILNHGSEYLSWLLSSEAEDQP